MYNTRQQTIFEYIKKQKTVTRNKIQSYISEIFPIKNSKVTLLRDLNLLINDRKITKSGKTKNVAYSYSISSSLDDVDVESYFETDPDKRILKSEYFNFDVWNNIKHLFTDKELNDLIEINENFRKNKKMLSATAFKKELERLTIEFSWKSSKIEGNTYSLIDTERLIKEHIEAKGKKKEEAVMILNHKKALDFIYEKPEYFKKLNLAKIEDIHRMLITGLDVSFGLRKSRVGITGTNYHPLDNIHQIKDSMESLIGVINKTKNPLEKALIAVLMISYIQPFDDGNKRTARILGNALLLAYDYCPLSYRSIDETEYKKAVILFYEQNSIFYFKKLFIEQFYQAIKKYF
ncbi:MAG: Fic family protein [Endomicrobium sp.]|jgi:Fic family protein|nr:Fic family protein [Endomicrobium sp.]